MEREIVSIQARMPLMNFLQPMFSGKLPGKSAVFLRRIQSAAFCLILVFATCASLICNGEPTKAAIHADQVYQTAKSAWEAHPENMELAWQFARACYDRADVAASDNERIRIAREGIAAARQVIQHDPQIAAGHYYLGMDLGQVAMIKRMSALRMVNDMEDEFEKTRLLDEKFDYAGPDRCLGMLYRDAPGWPLSVGNRGKARQHLLRAVEVDPTFPENHLALIEAYLKWGDWSKAAQQALKLEALIPEARKRLSGVAWEHDWTDWDQRWEVIQLKLADKIKPDWHKTK